MNRASLLTVLIASALVAMPAWAGSDEAQSLTVRSSVPVRCKMSPPTLAGSESDATFAPTSSGGELDFSNFVDAASDKTRAFSAELQFPIICSGAHTLTVTTQEGGLTNSVPATAGSGFAARANYALTASWAGTTKSLQTAGSRTTLDLSQTAPASGNLELNVNVPAGVGPLQAGAYGDAIIVQLNSAQ